MPLSNLPLKGTSDWLPEEFRLRKYIFDTWRQVCTRFGYEEYLTPLLEPSEVYKAKSGEDVGGVELTTLTDRGGRELAIRPEMTPSVTRMVSRIYNQTPKPIRLFSIANFYRNENPQRGRNREFWQLNFDIFGSNSNNSDQEIIQMAIEIMLAFNPPEKSFSVNLNDRRLIDAIIPQSADRKSVVRIMDKFAKLPLNIFKSDLKAVNCTDLEISRIEKFLTSFTPADLLLALPDLEQNPGFINCQTIISSLNELGYQNWINFRPNVIRGFDYYDEMVFEVFDNNPQNSRAMFGGGRYNGLASLFGSKPFPAVGCAPGDETTKLFLEAWDILPTNISEKYYLPLLDASLPTKKIANKLRSEQKNVTLGLEVESISKSLEFALKNNFNYLVIFGTQEAAKNTYLIKNLRENSQKEFEIGSI